MEDVINGIEELEAKGLSVEVTVFSRQGKLPLENFVLDMKTEGHNVYKHIHSSKFRYFETQSKEELIAFKRAKLEAELNNLK